MFPPLQRTGGYLMNLRQLEAFRSVMKEGSVTQAATVLGVTQPAISCLIGNLEDALGFMLFKRHRGRFQPTREAEVLLEDAERLLASYNRTVRSARDIRDLKSGSLRIASMPALSLNFLPKIIARFIQDRPEVNVTLHTRSSLQIREWVSVQLFDIGFVELPADDPGIDCDPFSVNCVCALPEAHPLTAKTVISPTDLEGERLIAPNQDHSVHYQMKAAFEGEGRVWNPHVECHLFAPACRMVAEGAGIAIVDPFTAADFADQGVSFRPFVPHIPYDIGLIYPALRPRSRLTVSFADDIKTALGDMPH